MPIQTAKAAYTTRRVPRGEMAGIARDAAPPRAGDLVLALVEELGQHPRLELCDGRRASLFRGDEIVVCFANRYAPDQFEATVPDDLGPCDLVAAGGIAARELARHAGVGAPTRLCPLGLVAGHGGERLNVADFALPPARRGAGRPVVIAIVGTAMNAGKTTAAAHLARGLTATGLTVGTAKVTGTGAGGDAWLMRDAGATPVLDFTDAGAASTSGLEAEALEHVLDTLVAHLAGAGAQVALLEVADGLLQRETAVLLASPGFRTSVDGVLFAAGDAMGAVAGSQALMRDGHPLLGLCGLLTASPLAAREAAAATGLEVLGLDALADPGCASLLALAAGTRRTRPREESREAAARRRAVELVAT